MAQKHCARCGRFVGNPRTVCDRAVCTDWHVDQLDPWNVIESITLRPAYADNNYSAFLLHKYGRS